MNRDEMLNIAIENAKGTDGIILEMIDPINEVMGANIFTLVNPIIVEKLLSSGNYKLIECEQNKKLLFAK